MTPFAEDLWERIEGNFDEESADTPGGQQDSVVLLEARKRKVAHLYERLHQTILEYREIVDWNVLTEALNVLRDAQKLIPDAAPIATNTYDGRPISYAVQGDVYELAAERVEDTPRIMAALVDAMGQLQHSLPPEDDNDMGVDYEPGPSSLETMD